MIQLTDKVFVEPSAVSAIEDYKYKQDVGFGSGSCINEHAGAIVILNCGRKIYVEGGNAKELFEKVNAASNALTECHLCRDLFHATLETGNICPICDGKDQ